MKIVRILFLLIIFIYSGFLAKAQYEKRTEREWARAKGSPLGSIYFLNQKVGWSCGGSDIYRTLDCGDTWQIMDSTEHSEIKTFFAIDSSICFMAGNGFIKKSTNSGRNWKTQKAWGNENEGVTIFSIHFMNKKKGIACGNNGRIFRTTNGGEDWIPIVPVVVENLTMVYFKNATQGWIYGNNGTLLITNNGGKKWKLKKIYIVKKPVGGHSRGEIQPDNNLNFRVGNKSSNGFTIVENHGKEYVFQRFFGYWTFFGERDPIIRNSMSSMFYDSKILEKILDADGSVLWKKVEGERFPSKYDFTLRYIFQLNYKVAWGVSFKHGLNKDFTRNLTKVFRTVDGGKTWIMGKGVE